MVLFLHSMLALTGIILQMSNLKLTVTGTLIFLLTTDSIV
jgi:hypothetical protein